MVKHILAALLAGSALCEPVIAQDSAAGAADAAPLTAEEVRALRDEVRQLRREVAELRGEAAARHDSQAVPAEVPPRSADIAVVESAPAPSWKGAPQMSEKGGWSFKPKGTVQFDAGFVGTPGPERSGTVGGLNYNNLGWNARARRLIIGAEGTMPGGFGYKAEFNFAQGTVDYEDIILSYQRPGSPIQVTVGNFYPLPSLETMTSSRVTSFLERASLTDAFVYNRRLGLAVAYLGDDDLYSLTAGLWSAEINNTGFNRTGWQASARATYSPTMGSTKLHLGANVQHRVAQRDAQNVQYRSRPFTQITDQRFVDTGLVAADGDDIAGLELGAIHGPFHFAGEAQHSWVRAHRPGHAFGPNNGAAGGLFFNGDPAFTAGYVEIGYYLTGETRGYKGGKWDRTKVLKPFDNHGWGAIQLNARIDFLDLRDRVSGATLAAPDYVNGGRQIGYQLSLIWNPMDYVRFMAQYAHGAYSGGPRATTVDPTSTEPANSRGYSNDSMAVRAQVEF